MKLLTTLSFFLFLGTKCLGQCYVDKVKINAFLHDPNGSPNNFDTDGNGTVSSTRDEFVQICNDSSGAVNIAGWTISDAGGFSHSFVTGTSIPANSCLTIVNDWAGTPPAYVYDLGTGSAIWNNSSPGDDIIISNGTTSCTTSYGGGLGNGCAMVVSGANSTTVTADCNLSPSDLSSSPLPVELLAFTAKSMDNYIQLDWTTASELNNSHFEIQRSPDGLYFETIARLEGAGSTNQVTHYSFIDANPNSRNYYRLRQVDFDGNFAYSPTIQVNETQNDLIIYQTLDNVYLTNSLDYELEYIVKDGLGNVVLSDSFSDTEIISKLVLPKGLLYVNVRSGAFSKTEKIIVIE